ncbi:MAG: hypothetical protein WC468_02090 [Candidatus Paceibacterota bacterium]
MENRKTLSLYGIILIESIGEILKKGIKIAIVSLYQGVVAKQ